MMINENTLHPTVQFYEKKNYHIQYYKYLGKSFYDINPFFLIADIYIPQCQ